MTTTPPVIFSYTSGNPDNLVGGDNAAMTDIQGPLYDIEAWLNGGNVQALVTSGAFIVGEIRFFAMARVDTLVGWLICDGQERLISSYPALAAALGTTYGTAPSGTSYFMVPDLRGRVVVGTGTPSGGGIQSNPAPVNRTIGTKWGVDATVLGAANIPQHAHAAGTIQTPVHSHDVNPPGWNFPIGNTSFTHGSGVSLAAGGYAIPILGLSVAANGQVSWASGTANAGPFTNTGTSGNYGTAAPTPVSGAQPSIAIPGYIYAGQ